MSYLGRGVDRISNVETLDNITFDGSSSYSITKGSSAFVPNSSQSCLLSIDGVVQSGNFTVSGSTIDFGVAISSSSTCNFFLHFGTGLVTTPSDGSVTRDKLNLVSDGSNPSLIAKGTSGVSEGYIQLNCAENSHGVKIKSPPHSAGQSYTLTLPQSITNNTFLKTDGSGNLSFASAGTVLQVVTNSSDSGLTTTSSSFVKAPLDVTITPTSTSSKIYITAQFLINSQQVNQWIDYTLYRGTGTNLGNSTGLGGNYSNNDSHVPGVVAMLDSPSTTASTLYSIYVKARGGVQMRYNPDGFLCNITAMEIAG